MKQVIKNLTEAFQDEQTPAHIKEIIASAILRLKQVEAVIADSFLNAVTKPMTAAQQGRFLNFKQSQGRFLFRETDRYAPCANSLLPSSPAPTRA